MSYENWEEKRRHKRFDSDLPVRFRPSGEGAGDYVEGRILNVSLGGIFIRTSNLLPIGTMMQLLIRVTTPFGEEQDIEAAAKICWHGRQAGEEGLGLQFTQIERHAQYAILACAYRGEV
jgi:c-di-GMP-binding flagellar brake protein YcgR